ncbi:MAG: DUF6263 family protein [Planctomycetota bacterium]
MNPRHALSALFALSLPLFAQDALDLRTAAKKGNSVWLVTTQKQDQVIEAMGQEMETGQTVTRTLQVTVLGDEGGNLIVETKIARVQGSMVMPMGMGDVEFDSAKPEAADDDEGMAGMMTKALTAGAGKSFRAKVSPHGKVVELLDGAAELTKNEGGGGMMAGPSLSKGDLEQMVESAFGFVPEKPTAIGAKWEHVTSKADGRMPMQQKMELTLAKADAESFEITATGTVAKPEEKADGKADGKDDGKSDEAEEAAMAREMMKSMKLSNGKLVGSQKVSRQDGFVVEATNTMTVDAEMSSQMGDMKMSIKSVTTTKRTTEDAAMPKKEAPKNEEPKKDAGK